ncbi:hypothetical protein [Vibrio sp. D431a]|uniref:hypothetical protein n=1 Tax=Vibrio sp. D431a TaxID=2837388 RepID=UPI002557B7AA|nr:hypothetical protein [Vibrio sp. D431a]MDK9793711.1 hypothetical protein [Vibrio sp. D431a]
MSVNDFLLDGEVVVGIDEKYNSNDGAYSIAYVWSGKEVRVVNYANGYNNRSWRDAEVNATPEQIKAAGDWCELDTDSRITSLLGCTVVLGGSRKAPNKVPLKVFDFQDGYFDEQYRHHVAAKVLVETENGRVWVGESCVKEVVKHPRPFWAK